MSGRGFIAEELPQVCEICGVVDECRPYGPNDEQICINCATATPESKAVAERKMAAYIFGEQND